jgi:outer membrane protein OmpA-like peptidoglycan-associated protein
VAETLFARLSSIVNASTVTEIARLLGAPEPLVSRGLALSAGAAFTGLARKADDSDTLHRVFDAALNARGDAVESAVSAGQLTDAHSPLLAEGTRLLGSIFGGSQQPVANAIGRESGLTSTAVAALLPLAAQALLSFLGARIRDDGMTPASLAGFLKRGAPEVRKALPASLDDAIAQMAPPTHPTADINPAVTRGIRSHRSAISWLIVAAIAIPALLWLTSRSGNVRVDTPRAVGTSGIAVGTSGVSAPANLGALKPRTLADGTVIRIPEYGVENRLLAFIGNPSLAPDTTRWFDFDRLLFATGATTLLPQSAEQLRDVAAILKANPAVHVKIGGYTDNVGSAEENQKLSQERAINVMNALVRMGVAPTRLEAEGYGEEHPVASNATETGRAQNRRISMLVTQK